MTGSGKIDALGELRYWFGEAERIARWTRQEAERLGFRVPSNFCHEPAWWQAEAEMEKAAVRGDYVKTRDLARAYIVRVDSYCRRWLAIRMAKGATA